MKTPTIYIGSTNPVKVRAVQESFDLMMPGHGFSLQTSETSSGVAAQPMTDLETHTGAKNRVFDLKGRFPNAMYWVGVE